MRIQRSSIVQRSRTAELATKAFSKGIVRTPQRPLGKQCIERGKPIEQDAVRDFARNRVPEDGRRQRLDASTRGLSRAFGQDDKERAALRGRGGTVEDAARAEAGGQRGALWERLREVFENRFRDRHGGGRQAPGQAAPGEPSLDGLVPPMGVHPPIRKIGKPDIIRTPVTNPRTTLPS